MKKFLTLLFAFTCLAFSEMRGQNVYFFSYDMGPGIQMSTVDGINFNCVTSSGVSLNYPYFVEYSGSEVFGPNSKNFGTSSFPTGIAKLTQYGMPGPINISGGLKISYNIQSKEYVFVPNCGSIISSQITYSTLVIHGNSCKLEVSSSGFSNFQWKRNGIDIPGANSSTYFHPGSLTNPNYVYSCVALCSSSGEFVNSNDLTINTGNPTFNLKADLDSNFCQSKKMALEVFGSVLGWEVTWEKNGSIIMGVTGFSYNAPAQIENSSYSVVANCPNNNVTITTNNITIKGSSSISVKAEVQASIDYCSNRLFKAQINPPGTGWVYQWKKDEIVIPGATDTLYSTPPQQQNVIYSCVATCSNTSGSKETNTIFVPACFGDSSSAINYLLVQNVTTTGNNASNKTIQVQFDLSWGNTWWDDINWDAAWVFMKYKTASGEWKHAKINPTGYDHGQGSPNIIQPTADKMGAFIRLGLKGQGNFNAEGMQLQWNYGLDGLNSVNGLEVKVFAFEMVYQPQGDFTLSTDFTPGAISAPAGGITVVNSRLSPILTGGFRIKGDAGIDLNADGAIDNTSFPTGYKPFYIFKYEMSEQAYADFLNCLTTSQITNLGLAGTSLTLNQGQYFSSFPNRACNGATKERFLAYADWSALRPISFFEFHKSWNGPKSPNLNMGICTNGTGLVGCDPIPANANINSGKGFFGAKNLIGNVWEPFVGISNYLFSEDNGDGVLGVAGNSDKVNWSSLTVEWGNFLHEDYSSQGQSYPGKGNGFRLCRSAE